ncbi:MAG: dihydropyrimidinase [Betaproteobacteria bacterium RBG_16_66_20]|nr:MAG: dihydropyrimidinase [Betaproteobacteria bacterium RBG_16_66_20]
MDQFDLTIRNGTVATAAETMRCDIGVIGEKVVAIAERLAAGARDIDAGGRYVLPGGIDSHCHIAQLSGMGIMSADDFYSGTVSAAFGGTTTIIPFAAQHRGTSVTTTVADYHERARGKAVIDYGFHLIIGEPTDKVLNEELPAAIKDGITSFKVYMTYPKWRLEDYQLLEVLSVAHREGALVMVHAENDDMIRWIAKRLIERGHGAPKFHGVAHHALAEAEATHRAIMLSRLLSVPVLIVHVSSPEATNTIRAAQTLGAKIYAETCPQYLVLTADDMDRPGVEGAKWCCSPPLRDKAAQEAIWAGLGNGTFQVYSSDHAPYRFDETAKIPRGDQTTFKEMANGVPGIEMRLPILFSEGVLKGRLGINQFVALSATNHARMYGLYPRKGTIAIGSDADIAIWNPAIEKRIDYSMMHDAVGYTPYEGHVYKGWPEIVTSRGRIVVEGGELKAARGSGQYLARGLPGPLAAAGTIDGPARQLRNLIG